MIKGINADLILILTGTLGTLGFGLVMNLKRSRLIYIIIGGFLTSFLYVICKMIFVDEFFMNLVPTIVAAVYAEVLARVVKAPVTVFMIPSLIPLIPGSALYQTMNCIITQNQDQASLYGIQTIKIAFSIAAGIVSVSAICDFIFEKVREYKK